MGGAFRQPFRSRFADPGGTREADLGGLHRSHRRRRRDSVGPKLMPRRADPAGPGPAARNTKGPWALTARRGASPTDAPRGCAGLWRDTKKHRTGQGGSKKASGPGANKPDRAAWKKSVRSRAVRLCGENMTSQKISTELQILRPSE